MRAIHFASRSAADLGYQSTREDDVDRATRKAQKILRRLGGDGDLTAIQFLTPPKGMHWQSFNRLISSAKVASERSWAGLTIMVDDRAVVAQSILERP